MEQNKELTYVWIENRTWKSISFFILNWLLFLFLIFCIYFKLITKDNSIPTIFISILVFIGLLGLFFSELEKIVITIVEHDNCLHIKYVFKKKKIIKISEIKSFYGYRTRGGGGLIFNTQSEIIKTEFFDMYNLFAYFLQSKGIKVEGIKVKKYPLSKILTNVPEKFKKLVETKNEGNNGD